MVGVRRRVFQSTLMSTSSCPPAGLLTDTLGIYAMPAYVVQKGTNTRITFLQLHSHSLGRIIKNCLKSKGICQAFVRNPIYWSKSKGGMKKL